MGRKTGSIDTIKALNDGEMNEDTLRISDILRAVAGFGRKRQFGGTEGWPRIQPSMRVMARSIGTVLKE
jgi:hypothetical protein